MKYGTAPDGITRDRLVRDFDFSGAVTTNRHTRNVNALAGAPAGFITEQGYRRISIDGRCHFDHRLRWYFWTGEWPMQAIDHINGNRLDNRRENLRMATDSENKQNQHHAYSNNTSGKTGVTWNRERQLWRARISINGKRVVLGDFASFEAAVAAREAGERELHPRRKRRAARHSNGTEGRGAT